jgi:hypothetical protein
MLGGVPKKLTAFGVALAMSTTPAFAAASSIPPQAQISPLVALSSFGSQASAAALCGSSATAATASAAATAQAPAGGCVLPVVDAPPPVPVAEAPPLPPPHGFGIGPVLLGLAGIAILAALIASQHHDNDNNPPVSVN